MLTLPGFRSEVSKERKRVEELAKRSNNRVSVLKRERVRESEREGERR